MKFPYHKFKDGSSRPVVEIEILHNGKALRYFAMIDSGADVNLFHSEIADALGIEIEKGIKMKVAGITDKETQAFYVHPIELKIGGWKYETTAGFMPGLAKNGYGILGQSDFFSLFKKVAFDFNKREIELV